MSGETVNWYVVQTQLNCLGGRSQSGCDPARPSWSPGSRFLACRPGGNLVKRRPRIVRAAVGSDFQSGAVMLPGLRQL
jgi:hypothetical protein